MSKCRDCAFFEPNYWCTEFAEEVSPTGMCDNFEGDTEDIMCRNCVYCASNYCGEFAEEVSPNRSACDNFENK